RPKCSHCGFQQVSGSMNVVHEHLVPYVHLKYTPSTSVVPRFTPPPPQSPPQNYPSAAHCVRCADTSTACGSAPKGGGWWRGRLGGGSWLGGGGGRRGRCCRGPGRV